MSRAGLIVSLVAAAGCWLAADPARAAVSMEYPIHIVDVYNPGDNCWKGMSKDGVWPVPVDPRVILLGEPEGRTAVSLPPDYWVEVRFRGHIVDGPGGDIQMAESGRMGEMALVYLTDDFGREYPLTRIQAADDQTEGLTDFDIDIAGVDPGFVPTGIRLVSIDNGGGSPGFDITWIRARVETGSSTKACEPIPPNRAHGVDPRTVLKWSPMQNAAKNVVYLGTDYADVAAGAEPVTDPPLPADVNYYDPGGLMMARTYFWRVDQIDSLGGLHRGDIWSFEVADKLVVDNFEYYGYSAGSITGTWRPGYYTYLQCVKDPVYRCSQAMSYDYQYYFPILSGQALMTFDKPWNFRAMGVQSIELAFRGETKNANTGQLTFLVGDDVNGVGLPYDNDPEYLRQTIWHTWRMNLSDAVGVDVNNVRTLGIQYDMTDSDGGYGTLYFDDLTLYPARCLPERRPAGDFDGNCLIDFRDARQLASDWLEQGRTVLPVRGPNQPVAWYEFEDDFTDSAGSFDATAVGDVNFTDGVYGRAASFNNTYLSVSDAAGLFSHINKAITVMFWQYGFDSVHHTDTICCTNYTYGVSGPALSINLGCWLDPGRYNFDCGDPFSSAGRLAGDHAHKGEWAGRWNHWTFIKDTRVNAGPGSHGVMKIYLNGRLYDIKYGSDTPVADVSQFFIGTGWYGYYDGLLDDFRIYDYPLSDEEIAFAATNGTGVFDQDLLSPGDVTGDRLVNFDDLAVLADNWLVDYIWP